MLPRIVSARGVLGQRDRFGELHRPIWPEFELLEREDLRARPTVCLDEMHAKFDQQLLHCGAVVAEVESEGHRVADRGHGRRNVNLTHVDAGRRQETEDFERLWLSALYR